jgi:hypothetical protein
MRMTPTCRSSPPPRWLCRRSTTAPAMDLHCRRRHAPPTFRLLMQSSFRSCLAISRSLCYALRAARRLSTVALFWLKIASSGRGALAETRWVHFNCNNKRAEESAGAEGLRKDRHHNKNAEQTRCIEEIVTHKFLFPLMGEHWEQPRRRPRVGLPLDRLHHAALDLKG